MKSDIKEIYNKIGGIILRPLNAYYIADFYIQLKKITNISEFESIDELILYFIENKYVKSDFHIELGKGLGIYIIKIDVTFGEMYNHQAVLYYSMDNSILDSKSGSELDNYIQLRCKELKRMTIIDKLLDI